MRTSRLFALLMLLAFIAVSCNRTMTPYEAANHGKMKHCRTLR